MKGKFFSKVVATVLAVFLVFGTLSFAGSDAYAEGGGSIIIKASELNQQLADHVYTYIDAQSHFSIPNGWFNSVELVLDEDIHLASSEIHANFTISGNYSLYLDYDSQNSDLYIYGNLTIKRDAELVIDSEQGGVGVMPNGNKGGNIYIYGNISFRSGLNIVATNDINIYSGRTATEMSSMTANEEISKSVIFAAQNNLNISGGLIECRDNLDTFLYAYGNLDISGGEINAKANKDAITCYGDVSISGGTVNIESETGNALFAGYTVTISDYANVTLNSTQSALSGRDISFKGGYLETNNTGTGSKASLSAEKSISISDDCHIAQPENGVVGVTENYSTIYNQDGTIPKKVVLEENTPEGVTPPEAIEGLVYNGRQQQLVTAGKVGTNPLEYQVEIVFNGYKYGWTDRVPTALDALDYEVSYREKGKSKVLGKVAVRIERKDVTVTADDLESYVGEDLKEITYKIEGLVDGDTEEDLGLVETWCDADKDTPGTYPIGVRMNDSYVSYRITEVFGTYTVKNYSYKVEFDTDGGSKIDPVEVEMGKKLAKPADPVKDGFTFDGWYFKDKAYDFDLPVITNFTLTAKWTKNEEPDDKKDDDQDDDKGDQDDKKDETKPSSEWIDGKWYNADGTQDYSYTGSWKSDASGWWFEDESGWYPTSQWQKIDGKWYYFCADGYMDYSEYRDGCWLGADGAWVEAYAGGHWMSDSTGWWYEDASGWYPQDQYLWIDGTKYWFGSDGYWA